MDEPVDNVRVTICRGALEAIFDECDLYDCDETGGRLIGSYNWEPSGVLSIAVSGVIEPGAAATRTATSFFQDGQYQERVFRRLESKHPEIEHLGNWHSHHVNGYPTLSGGDRQTYHRIVDHAKHNTDFFYALLVTARNTGLSNCDRYQVKHFILHRERHGEREIPATNVTIVDKPSIWPRRHDEESRTTESDADKVTANPRRAKDNTFFQRLFPDLRPYLSKNMGTVYWRGSIALCDDSSFALVVAEMEDGGTFEYRVFIADPLDSLRDTVGHLTERRFQSASEAAVTVEREVNREVLRNKVTEVNSNLKASKGR